MTKKLFQSNGTALFCIFFQANFLAQGLPPLNAIAGARPISFVNSSVYPTAIHGQLVSRFAVEVVAKGFPQVCVILGNLLFE